MNFRERVLLEVTWGKLMTEKDKKDEQIRVRRVELVERCWQISYKELQVATITKHVQTLGQQNILGRINLQNAIDRCKELIAHHEKQLEGQMSWITFLKNKRARYVKNIKAIENKLLKSDLFRREWMNQDY